MSDTSKVSTPVINGILKFTEDSPYYQSGEKERVLENITEIHYKYCSPMGEQSTAFESDVDGTGFTVRNKYIKEFEVVPGVTSTKTAALQ